MLMLIFGYYQPLLNTISALRVSFGHSVLVLGTFAAGLVVGFFTIAKLMQFLLKRFRRATYWSIVGFVIGSIPAVIITFFHEYGDNLTTYLAPWQIAVGVICFVLGAIATFLLARFAVKHSEKAETAVETESPTENGEGLEK